MKGHEPIIRARKRGKKPTMVTVRYGLPAELPVWEGDRPLDRLSVGLPPVVYVEKGEIPDMRFVTGCNVLFEADVSTQSGNRIVQNIIKNEPKELIYATSETKEFGIWRGGKWHF